MYAIIEANGVQLKVKENEEILIPKLSVQDNDEVTFDKVLMYFDEKEEKIGQPYIENAKVKARVTKALEKGDKIISYKYKPKKNYHRKKGFRAQYTRLKIEKIEV